MFSLCSLHIAFVFRLVDCFFEAVSCRCPATPYNSPKPLYAISNASPGLWLGILKHCHTDVLYDFSPTVSIHFFNFSGLFSSSFHCITHHNLMHLFCGRFPLHMVLLRHRHVILLRLSLVQICLKPVRNFTICQFSL